MKTYIINLADGGRCQLRAESHSFEGPFVLLTTGCQVIAGFSIASITGFFSINAIF